MSTGITPDIVCHQLFLLLQLLRDLGRLRYLRQLPQVPRRRRVPRDPGGVCGRVRRDVAGRRPVGRRKTGDGQNRPAGVADPGGGHCSGVVVPIVHAVVGHRRRRRDVPRVVVVVLVLRHSDDLLRRLLPAVVVHPLLAPLRRVDVPPVLPAPRPAAAAAVPVRVVVAVAALVPVLLNRGHFAERGTQISMPLLSDSVFIQSFLPHHPAPAHRLPVAVVRVLAAHALVVVVPLGQRRVAPCTAEGRQEGGAPLAALLPLPFPLSAAALLFGLLSLGLLGGPDL